MPSLLFFRISISSCKTHLDILSSIESDVFTCNIINACINPGTISLSSLSLSTFHAVWHTIQNPQRLLTTGIIDNDTSNKQKYHFPPNHKEGSIQNVDISEFLKNKEKSPTFLWVYLLYCRVCHIFVEIAPIDLHSPRAYEFE